MSTIAACLTLYFSIGFVVLLWMSKDITPIINDASEHLRWQLGGETLLQLAFLFSYAFCWLTWPIGAYIEIKYLLKSLFAGKGDDS